MDKPTKKQLRTLERLGALADAEYDYDGYIMLASGHAFVSLCRDGKVTHKIVGRDGKLLDRKQAAPVLKAVLGAFA